MLKIVFLVHKRADMDVQDFRRHWRETQGAISAKIPGVRKYVQNHTIAAPDEAAPPYDGFAEMWFDNKEALEHAMASPQAQAAIADLPNFLDPERMQSFIVDKNQHYLKHKLGTSAAEYDSRRSVVMGW